MAFGGMNSSDDALASITKLYNHINLVRRYPLLRAVTLPSHCRHTAVHCPFTAVYYLSLPAVAVFRCLSLQPLARAFGTPLLSRQMLPSSPHRLLRPARS